MYSVTVRRGRKVVDRKSFAFGDWQSIGYWLDDSAYIAQGYTVTITFEEEN